MPLCNICSTGTFLDFNKRKQVQCSTCKSLERHRLVKETLGQLGYLDRDRCLGIKRALHLAPESMTYRYLLPVFGSGYVVSDMAPEKYPHCQALRLSLPAGFDLFPSKYFDLILHNHVLEHIPGSYKAHIDRFVDLLKSGGHMVFTIPSIQMDNDTIEGGEHLPTDEDRLRAHGQNDHYKSFGKDFLAYCGQLKGKFFKAEINASVRASINAHIDVVYVFQKS